MRSCLDLISLTLLSLSALPLSSGVKLAIKPRSSHSGAVFGAAVANSASNRINNINNERYTASILLNGKAVTVMLDTGSTDLWAAVPQGIGEFKPTNLTANLTYGDGSDFVYGPIGIAPLEFGGYTISEQAFVNATTLSSSNDADLDDGINGLLGLSFDSAGASRVNDAVTSEYGEDATWGQSVLANIFAQHPDKQNFIAVSLSRTDDLEGTAQGTLNIGEYDDDYPQISSAPHLPLLSPGAWDVYMDGIIVNGKPLALSSAVSGVDDGKQVALLDSGTTNVMLSAAFVNAIYGSIPGAQLAKDTTIPSLKYSTDSDVWVVPCLATISVSAVFGGQEFPIHPLDLTDMHQETAPDSNNYTICTGTFTNIGDIGEDRLDGLWVPRSYETHMLCWYDFGDSKSTRDPSDTAFMQLLSLTNASDAINDLNNVRKKNMQSMAKELAPADIIAIYADNHVTKSATNPDEGETAASSAYTAKATSTAKSGTLAANLDNEDSTSTSNALNKWVPIAVGLLAANLLVGIVLLVLGILTCVRKGGRINSVPGSSPGLRGLALGSGQSYAPVKINMDVEDGKDERFEGGRLYGQ